jgi:hypothetical protein
MAGAFEFRLLHTLRLRGCAAGSRGPFFLATARFDGLGLREGLVEERSDDGGGDSVGDGGGDSGGDGVGDVAR